ncbi:MAG: LamG domain-containing protein [Desulfuromonadales bacterium]|nr:LamG domain-containing protein [Desulfuromonadales bacterium]
MGIQDSAYGAASQFWNPLLYVGTDGKLYGGVWTTSPQQVVSGQSVADGAWHHAVLSYGGNTVTLYLDGVSLGTATGTISQSMPTSQIGSGYTVYWPSANNGWYDFNGQIDEVSIHNRVLSSGEILAVFKAGNSGFCSQQHTLSVTISGSGDGAITPSEGSFAWVGKSGAASYYANTGLTLMATPDANSLFNSWSGDCAGTSVNCDLLMDGNKGAVASFTYVEPARVETTGLDYPHIRDAYTALSVDGTILARQFQFDGGLSLDQGWKLLLKGGYNAAYTENSGFSTIAGALTVKTGRLTVERVLVK